MFDDREKERAQIKVYVLKETEEELLKIAHAESIPLSQLMRRIVLDYLKSRGIQ